MVGAHPNLLTFAAHSKDAGKLSPSQVLRIDAALGDLDEVMLDDGSLLSGSSIAALYGKRIFVVPVLDPGYIAGCLIKHRPPRIHKAKMVTTLS